MMSVARRLAPAMVSPWVLAAPSANRDSSVSGHLNQVAISIARASARESLAGAMTSAVPERTSARYDYTLLDEDDQPVPLAA
jgi:hypothetical protein